MILCYYSGRVRWMNFLLGCFCLEIIAMTYQRKERGGRGVGYVTVVSFKGYIHFKVNAHVTNNVFVFFFTLLCAKRAVEIQFSLGAKK